MLTFGFVWSSKGVVCALIDMEYVASDELGDLIGLGIVREVNFTYVGPVSSN